MLTLPKIKFKFVNFDERLSLKPPSILYKPHEPSKTKLPEKISSLRPLCRSPFTWFANTCTATHRQFLILQTIITLLKKDDSVKLPRQKIQFVIRSEYTCPGSPAYCHPHRTIKKSRANKASGITRTLVHTALAGLSLDSQPLIARCSYSVVNHLFATAPLSIAIIER